MAQIGGNSQEKIYSLKKWLGLNQNPDGDTKLKYGEAAVMRNWRITRDGNLRRRPGSRMILGLGQSYQLSVEEESRIARRDEGRSSVLVMFPEAEASYWGFVELSGEKAAVSAENAADYSGHYWKQDENHVWQLVECIPEGAAYLWYMRRVYAVGDCGKVTGLWSGMVAERECVLAACDGRLYQLFNGAEWTKDDLGTVDTAGDVFVFGFGGNAYILDGDRYRVFDGEAMAEVEGYIPLVSVGNVPTGGGTSLEQANKLTPKRRVQFSPDGEAVTFQLPETKITAVDYVKNTATGEAVEHTANLVSGTITFDAAPETGINTIEVQYTATDDEETRMFVERMRYAELYNGAQDSRVFLYGDGSNQAVYSGLDTAGQPRADYFPDLNQMAVGESNTPITAMVRHGSRLLVFKTNSTYSVYYSTVSLADGSVTAGFYISPVHRSLGNVAPGQVQVVTNYPRTLHGMDCFEWKNASTYFTADERQAKRISDRIQASLKLFDLDQCRCWDDNDRQEYYICYDRQALVHNYAADAWYYYTGFDAVALMNFREELYIGTSDGRVLNVDDRHLTDCGDAIDAYWESGSMDFDADYRRKYTSTLWVTVRPESNSYVEITAKTDRKLDNAEKAISKGLGLFSNMSFSNFSFNTSDRPQVKRLRIKSKKYTFYKLVFQTDKVGTTATILQADIRVRQTGYAK